MESIRIPDHDHSPGDLRYQFRRIMAIEAHPQVLDNPYLRPRLGADEPETDRQLLTMNLQHMHLLLLLYIVQCIIGCSGVPRLHHLTSQPLQLLVDLPRLLVRPVTSSKEMHDPPNFNGGASGSLHQPLALDPLPDHGSLSVVVPSRVYIRQKNVVPCAIWLQSEQPL
ncbi:unnamed protein product [Spirodela intermedia]|uniref:Uncharacterized protein n=1 Tax=Spirodela intermedia TaxID=51605 RepID=A0A7I8LFM1_SPIIN|nr:unnamed protein product [Spirodela intermedia]